MNRIQFFDLKLKHIICCVAACFGICFSATFSGIVVDKENSNKPIPGVMVSSGYTTSRTLTDGQGHFALDASPIKVLSFNTPHSKSSLPIPWDRRKRLMDFSNAPGIAAVSIFSLNGSRLFHQDIRTKSRLVRIPSMPQGVFIMRAVLNDNSTYSWKWTTLDAHSVFNVPLFSAHAHAFGKSAAEGGEIRLLFRHDDYYPFERRLVTPAEDLAISMTPDPRHIVFDWTKIHSYNFTLTHEDSLTMERNARKEEYVPANFTFDSTSYGNVGLRYKGSAYSLPNCFDSLGNRQAKAECVKVSLKIKFNKYNKDTRFFDMKLLNLHSMSADPSKMHEMLSYALFREMGIYTCRTAYAKVYINGAFQGLFAAVEAIDGRFTKSRWPALGDGNLYKEVWPIAETGSYYIRGLETNNDSGSAPDVSRMINFYKAIQSSSTATFVRDISPFMDLDYWLRYIVVDRAIHNCDGIMTWYDQPNWRNNHNYYFYEEENAGGKLWLCPWDLHVTLTKTDMIIDDFNVPEWNVKPETCRSMLIWGNQLGIPPNCDPLIGLTASVLWNQFVAFGDQFLATCFNVERMRGTIDTLKNLIDPVIAEDSKIDPNQWRNNVTDLRLNMGSLNRDFGDYLHNRTTGIDTTGFTVPFPDSGFLRPDRVNNFEFTPATPISSWTAKYISPGSTISVAVNTTAPLWGKSDLLSAFVFYPADTTKMYAEWARLGVLFQKEAVCRELQRIRFNAKCDSPRNCWIFLGSKIYNLRGVNEEYGWSITIGAADKVYTLDMADIAYPSWANPGNPDLLDTVLAATQGIGFGPGPLFNSNGRLSVVPDSGYLKIDNIIFDFKP